METVKKAYDEIFEALKKYNDVCVFDINDLERKAKIHLFGLQLKEEFGLDIKPESVDSLDCIRIGDDRYIVWYGGKTNRTISWSDDGRQPEDELLFKISFPTGAYIFGGDYPTEFFHKFWMELKSYNPKYTDTANKSLYFSMDNAANIFNNYKSIVAKYNEENNKDVKLRKIAKMKEELEKLQST